MHFDPVSNLLMERNRLAKIMRKTLFKVQFQCDNNMYACALLGRVHSFCKQTSTLHASIISFDTLNINSSGINVCLDR